MLDYLFEYATVDFPSGGRVDYFWATLRVKITNHAAGTKFPQVSVNYVTGEMWLYSEDGQVDRVMLTANALKPPTDAERMGGKKTYVMHWFMDQAQRDSLLKLHALTGCETQGESIQKAVDHFLDPRRYTGAYQ